MLYGSCITEYGKLLRRAASFYAPRARMVQERIVRLAAGLTGSESCSIVTSQSWSLIRDEGSLAPRPYIRPSHELLLEPPCHSSAHGYRGEWPRAL